jgi:glycerol-3-phosphate acyltransferase PlsY
MMRITVLAIGGYLLGSVPFGYIVGKARGVDLRTVGSGNLGATNVYRTLGLGTALLVFAMDVAKGVVGTRVFPALLPAGVPVEYVRLICGIAVIAGSVASLYLGFRGGKGVAAGVGVFLGLAPLATAICVGIWAAVVARFRYVSLGSIAGAIALPILVAAFNARSFIEAPVFYLAVIVTAIVILRHKSNIRRLLDGTENRVGKVGGERVR